MLPPRSAQPEPTETKESISPTFGANDLPRLTDTSKDENNKPTETPENPRNTRTEGGINTTTSTPAPASVYRRAYDNGVTSMPISKARLYVPIQRYEAATMIVNYVKNVEKKEITPRAECDISKYSDISSSTNPAVRKVIQDVCNLGIMGVSTTPDKLIPSFRPYDSLSVNEIQIILKRYNASSRVNIRRNLRIDVMDLLMKTLK